MIKRTPYFGNPAYLNKYESIFSNEYIFSKVSGSEKGLIVINNEFSRTKNVNFGKDIEFEVSDSEIEKTSKVLTL